MWYMLYSLLAIYSLAIYVGTFIGITIKSAILVPLLILYIVGLPILWLVLEWNKVTIFELSLTLIEFVGYHFKEFKTRRYNREGNKSVAQYSRKHLSNNPLN